MRNIDNQVGIGTIIHMARAGGWAKQSRPQHLHPYAKRRFKPIPWEDVKNFPKREPLIKGLLDKETVSVIYGNSNSGKTFFALDMALHIAQGKPWRNHKTSQCAVVYIAAEGGIGLGDRLEAFKLHHKLDSYAPFYLIPSSVDFCKSNIDIDELIEEINQVDDVGLVVVDTLSRVMAGGNENSPDDMGALIKNGDRLKETCKTHVMFIHHSGKDSGKGARGHSSLRAAVETEIEVKRGEGMAMSATVTKQRDGKTDVKYHSFLLPVDLGFDDDGDTRSSCALVSTEEGKEPPKPLKGRQKQAFDLLEKLIADKGRERDLSSGKSGVRCIPLQDFKDALQIAQIIKTDKADSLRRGIGAVISELENREITGCCDGFIYMADSTDKSGKAKKQN